MKKETFYFLGFPITVRFFNLGKNQIIENDDFISDDYASTCTWLDKENKVNFILSFKFNELETIVHETYHLFFHILNYIQKRDESFMALDGEMYAYNFEELFINIKNTVDRLEKECNKRRVK